VNFIKSLQKLYLETYCPFAGVLPPFERPAPYSLPSARIIQVLKIEMCFLWHHGFKFQPRRKFKKAYHLVQPNVHRPVYAQEKVAEINKLQTLESHRKRII